MESEGDDNDNGMDDRGNMSDDDLGSCGSVDDAKTPPDDDESLNQSLSSPGAFSGLSSLQSPSTSLASPLTPNALLHNNNNSNSNNNNHTSNGLNSTSSGGAHVGPGSTASVTMADLPLASSTNATSQLNPPSKPLFADSPSICEPATASTNGSQPTKNHLHHSENSQITNQSIAMDTSPTEKKIRVHNSDDEKSSASASLYSSKGKSSSASAFDSSKNCVEKAAMLLNQNMNSHIQHQQYQQKMFLQSQQKHLQQPLGPHAFHFLNQPELFYEKIIRNPVGANPRDINNPLSINQLTKRDYANSASMALSPSALHHLMGVGSPLSSQGPSSHVPPQLFLSSAGASALNANPSADFHHFSLQQELLNHHQQNALAGRANQSSPSLNYQSARAFAASMMSAQHPYPHASHPAFSVTPDASVVVGGPPPASTSSAASSARLAEEASGAISVT